jgi:hypothetical protein
VPTIEDFDQRFDILIYTTLAEEYRIFAPTEKDAADIALEVCKQKHHADMVVRHEVIPLQLTMGCFKCADGREHVWHDNGEYNDMAR